MEPAYAISELYKTKCCLSLFAKLFYSTCRSNQGIKEFITILIALHKFSGSEGICTFRDLFLHISGLDAGEYIHQMCISKPPKKRKFLANSGAAAVKSNFVGKAVEKKHVLLVFQKSFSFFLFLKKIHIPLISNSYKVSQKFLIYI